MRWNLLKTYDKIYTIDLHGNSKKKETAPDGTADINVFDIMQGVSINIFVKTGKKKDNELGQVLHYDLFGKRDFKYDFLNTNSLKTVPYKELPNVAPDYFFVNKDFDEKAVYDEGFGLNELFTVNSVGIVTANDDLYISTDRQVLKNQIIKRYQKIDESLIRPISYRPFDTRFLYNNVDMIERSRINVMKHFLRGENIGITTVRRIKTGTRIGFFITNMVTDDALSGMSSSVVLPISIPKPTANKPLDKTMKEYQT
jgi:predicted helicase